jgi:protein MpaA
VEAAADLALRVAAGEIASVPFWVVAALNPDGLARGQKNSARDVDLNRNFAASNFTPAHAPGYDPGPGPLSEPETAALAALLAREAITRIVAVHAPFACVNYDGPAEAWAQAVAAACGWPVQADIGYPTPGSLGSWWGRDRMLPILTLELPPGPFSGFRLPGRAALAASVADPGIAMNPSRMR